MRLKNPISPPDGIDDAVTPGANGTSIGGLSFFFCDDVDDGVGD